MFTLRNICAIFLSIHVLSLWLLLISNYYTLHLSTNTYSTSKCPENADVRAVHYAYQVVYSDEVATGFIVVDSTGKIESVHKGTQLQAKAKSAQLNIAFHDHGSAVINPGLIDVHVHVSGVGGRQFEGYPTALQSSSAGGTTTIVTMPLNSLPPTTTIEALQLEVEEALSHSSFYSDLGFWAGGVPSNVLDGSLADLLNDKRVLGVKSFLSPLPPAAGYEAVTVEELFQVAVLSAQADLPLLVHCELMTLSEIDNLNRKARLENPKEFRTFLSTRPPEFERRAVDVVIELLDKIPTLKVHIVHLSDASCLLKINEAKKRVQGRLTVETCPHYLINSAEAIPDGETRLKCMPPIRDQNNLKSLWEGMVDGSIDMISSDHSPCAPGMRQLETGNFLDAWGGISGLQFNLPATWTAMKRNSKDLSLLHVAKWWSERPARLAGIDSIKGSLAVGKHADFVVWDPDAAASTDKVFHRHSGSPYAGAVIQGRVLHTYLRGVEVYHDDDLNGPEHVTGASCGRVLTRARDIL